MRSTGFSIILATVALAAGSCVKEDLTNCDGLVVVAVRDINYDNAAEVGDAVVADDLPMRNYIATLVTQEHPRGTPLHTPFEEPLSDAQLTYPLPPERLPGGVNELTVVGRALASAMLYRESELSRIINLHADGQEGEDVYLGGDAVEYPRMDDHTVWMLRTKGKLMVDVVGAPDNVANVTLSVDKVYATVTEDLTSIAPVRAAIGSTGDAARLRYGGYTTVSRTYPSEGNTATYHLILAPSAAQISPLRITFADSAGKAIYEPGAEIVIARNHITRVKAEYSVEERRWTLTVNVNGNWVKTENMTIS